MTKQVKQIVLNHLEPSEINILTFLKTQKWAIYSWKFLQKTFRLTYVARIKFNTMMMLKNFIS